jgi:competence protein ComEC
VVATHASRDHHGGLVEVLRRFPVDLLLDGGDGKPDPDFRRLQAEADRRGIRRLPALAGQRIRAGSIAVNVLSPPPRPPGPAPEDPNPRAVVAIVSAGSFNLFLSADAESEALGALELPDVEAMKVPHHGSSDPGLPAVLRRLRPQVAAIEVGRDNGYGHPAPSTLAALEAAVPRVHRTDLDGTVRLSVEGSALEVATER